MKSCRACRNKKKKRKTWGFLEFLRSRRRGQTSSSIENLSSFFSGEKGKEKKMGKKKDRTNYVSEVEKGIHNSIGEKKEEKKEKPSRGKGSCTVFIFGGFSKD